MVPVKKLLVLSVIAAFLVVTGVGCPGGATSKPAEASKPATPPPPK
jgi:hypothetical protein